MLRPYRTAIGERFDACGARAIERFAIAAVDVAGERKAVGGADLDEEQHRRAVAGGDHGGELVEVAGAAGRHRIRETRRGRARA